MTINQDLVLGLISIFFTLAGVIWYVANAKEKIYDHIDNKTNSLEKQHSLNQYEIDLKIKETQHLIDKDILHINGCVERNGHKSKRNTEAINTINKQLKKISNVLIKEGLLNND